MYPPPLFAVNINAGSGMVQSEPDSFKLEVSTTAGDGSEDLVLCKGEDGQMGGAEEGGPGGGTSHSHPHRPPRGPILTTLRPSCYSGRVAKVRPFYVKRAEISTFRLGGGRGAGGGL